MTWTKLGDEFGDECWRLSDEAFRTHVEALMWSNRLGLDLVIPKRQLPRFAFSDHAAAAAAELCAAGWWKDDGDYWDVAQRFPDWQVERAVVDKRRADTALRQRRHRRHKAGDHSLCVTCDAMRDVTRDAIRDAARDPTRDPGRDGPGQVRAGTNDEQETRGHGESHGTGADAEPTFLQELDRRLDDADPWG